MLEVVGMPWEEFDEWFHTKWQQGQHVAIIGPTGTGKTVLVRHIVSKRKYVAAFDPKGGDSSLAELVDSFGFEHSEWPPSKKVRKAIDEGRPARLLIGGKLTRVEDLPKLRNMIALGLKDVFNERGWTVYVDELQIASDRRMMNLMTPIERILIAARDRKVSLVTSYQRPAYVPRAASEMATWFGVFYTRDREVVTRIAEMAGRPSAEIRGLVDGLPEFCVIFFSRNPRDPVVVTSAPES